MNVSEVVMVPTEEREYITVEEAASREGVSSQTIRRAIRSGALVYRGKRGRVRLLDARELAEGMRQWRVARNEIKPIDGRE